ncbi:LysR family transcriptional regulator [Mesorhizobium sp. CAU 1741]|uniref:LysR family transcriptional regulator n=1 Tax=Mesorhizobium sp. CAU 1741 TaxID=3140366 RepID=UPI00325C0195
MRLEWLEDILAVAETGSFGEAAQRRGLTASAFSRRVQNIEEHVGIELFDRSRKPVELRRATAEHRDAIEGIAERLRQLVLDLRSGERASANRIVIVSQHALTTAIAPGIIDEIQSRNDGIFLRLRSANLDDCFAQLLAREADVAIVYRLPGTEHPVRADFVEVAAISSDTLVPVIGAGHHDRVLDLMRQGRLPYVAYPGDVFMGQVMERQILARLRPTVELMAKVETSLTLAALELAAVGVAVAWVPRSLARDRLDDGRLVDLSRTIPHCELEVTAVRALGAASATEQLLWDQLTRSR